MARKTSYFTIDRKLFASDLWTAEPFTKGQAWVDLIGNAAYTHKEYDSRGIKRQLERGQLGTSEPALARRWKWDRSRVRRFLQALVEDEAIEIMPTSKGSIITIINYDFYQSERTTERTTERTLTINIKKYKESIYIAYAAEIEELRKTFKGDVDALIDEYVDWRANHPEIEIHNDMAKLRDFARRQDRARRPRGKAKSIDDIAAEVLGGTQ